MLLERPVLEVFVVFQDALLTVIVAVLSTVMLAVLEIVGLPALVLGSVSPVRGVAGIVLVKR